ncbi:sensor histidine kinase [Bizionia arctica]|nr:histidine kinase [Bizionia arctica]
MRTFTTKDGLATNDVWGIYPTPDGKLWYLSKASRLGYIENDSVYAFESEEKGEIFNPIFSSQIGNDVVLTSSNRFHILEDKKWKLLANYKSGGLIAGGYVKNNEFSRFKTNETFDTLLVQDAKNNTIKTLAFSNVLERVHSRGQIADSLFYWVNDKQYSIINLNTLKFYSRSFQEEIGLETSKYLRINLINNQIQISGSGFVGILDSDLHIKNTYYIPEHLKAHFGFIDKSGSIWISTFTNGIYHLPLEKQSIQYSFPTETVTNINFVNNKIIANVSNKGFYGYDNSIREFVPFIIEEDYIFNASYIKELDTEYYLSKLNVRTVKNNVIREIDLSNNLYGINDRATQLVLYHNFLYGQFSFGINKINPENFKIESEYIQHGINQLLNFNNQLLVATSNGLKEFKDEEFESFRFDNTEFNKPILSIVKLSDIEVLINTDGFGTYISDLKTIRQLPKSEFLIVNNGFVDGTSIWLATESGVLKYAKLKDDYVLQMHLDVSNGLPSNNVNDLLVHQNQLMVCTNNGIAIIPKDLKIKSQLLDIYFDKASYNNQNITANNSIFSYQNNNNLSFTVTSIDFSEQLTNLSYNYKLFPLDKNWTATTTKNFNINNLKPGSYTFFIESNGIEKSLDFVIKPLWWQKIWFKAFMILLGIVFVTLVSRYFVRQSQFKKNQKIFQDKRLSELQLKALRSQMNPHFVFNSLSAIQYYIGENNFETSELYLVKFSKLIRQFFELSKENEISLSREVSLLNGYLEIEKLRFKEKLNFNIYVDPKLDTKTTKIPTMLLQPIVENAVNHGVFNKLENGFITLNFVYLDHQTFKVEIIDDGVGFVNTKKRENKNVKSSNVLKDRLHFLNYSEKWDIDYKTEELSPDLADRGNKATFLIKKIQK